MPSFYELQTDLLHWGSQNRGTDAETMVKSALNRACKQRGENFHSPWHLGHLNMGCPCMSRRYIILKMLQTVARWNRSTNTSMTTGFPERRHLAHRGSFISSQNLGHRHIPVVILWSSRALSPLTLDSYVLRALMRATTWRLKL